MAPRGGKSRTLSGACLASFSPRKGAWLPHGKGDQRTMLRSAPLSLILPSRSPRVPLPRVVGPDSHEEPEREYTQQRRERHVRSTPVTACPRRVSDLVLRSVSGRECPTRYCSVGNAFVAAEAEWILTPGVRRGPEPNNSVYGTSVRRQLLRSPEALLRICDVTKN